MITIKNVTGFDLSVHFGANSNLDTLTLKNNSKLLSDCDQHNPAVDFLFLNSDHRLYFRMKFVTTKYLLLEKSDLKQWESDFNFCNTQITNRI